MRYRRAEVPGASYFFTVNLAERSRSLLVDHADILRAVIREVQSRHPFHIDAMILLPDHLHAIWTLPNIDKDFSTRWMLIKTGFSRRIPAGERRTRSRLAKGERGIWQRRFWEHLIRDETDYERHVDYIHYNPVKHGYVARPVDWLHSSIHRLIEPYLQENQKLFDIRVDDLLTLEGRRCHPQEVYRKVAVYSSDVLSETENR